MREEPIDDGILVFRRKGANSKSPDETLEAAE